MPLDCLANKKRSFYTPLFCSQHFIFLFQHTEYVDIAIRFAHYWFFLAHWVFLAENPRALFLNFCTL